MKISETERGNPIGAGSKMPEEETEPQPSWAFGDVSACREALEASDPGQSQHAGRVLTLEHHVPVGGGQTLYLKEFFSPYAWLRQPRRAVLFLNGSVFTGNSWSIPVSGYNGPEMVAQRGMFAYTVDFIGTGRSSLPENGHETSVEKSVENLRAVLELVYSRRTGSQIDLVGEGYGGNVACQLAADDRRVRSCVLISMAYKDLVSGPTKSPEMVEMLRNSPDGYHSIPPQAYEPFMAGAPQEVRDYICSMQAGRYPVHVNLLADVGPPFFDAGVARAPGLVIFGARDFVVGPKDPYALAEDYGPSGARLVVNEQAGHAPRVESPATAGWLWRQIFDFIDK